MRGPATHAPDARLSAVTGTPTLVRRQPVRRRSREVAGASQAGRPFVACPGFCEVALELLEFRLVIGEAGELLNKYCAREALPQQRFGEQHVALRDGERHAGVERLQLGAVAQRSSQGLAAVVQVVPQCLHGQPVLLDDGAAGFDRRDQEP